MDSIYKKMGADMRKELNKIEERITKELHKRLLWRGTWRGGESYHVNDLVQDKNALHVCVATETGDRPTQGPGWRALTTVQK